MPCTLKEKREKEKTSFISFLDAFFFLFLKGHTTPFPSKYNTHTRGICKKRNK